MVDNSSIDNMVADYSPSSEQPENKGLMQRIRDIVQSRFYTAIVGSVVLGAGLAYGMLNPDYASAQSEAAAAETPYTAGEGVKKQEFIPDLSGYTHLPEYDKNVNNFIDSNDKETTARVFVKDGEPTLILYSLDNGKKRF